MAVVFEHMGIGTPRQVFHFLKQREAELKEALKNCLNERAMWKCVLESYYMHMGIAARGYIHSRIDDLNRREDALSQEVGTVTAIATVMRPCPDCNGAGTILGWNPTEEAEPPRETRCPSCNGSCIRNYEKHG